jgi:hypothetical protein
VRFAPDGVAGRGEFRVAAEYVAAAVLFLLLARSGVVSPLRPA